MNKAEKSLRWVVNQIPDFKPTTNEEKMLVAIKLYSEAGAEEIKRLESENAALRKRLNITKMALEYACLETLQSNEQYLEELKEKVNKYIKQSEDVVYGQKNGVTFRFADALIAAGIGDVKKEKFEADHYWNMWQGALVELERAEHRAARAERALKNACEDVKETVSFLIELSERVDGLRVEGYLPEESEPKAYINRAEKELAEEGKDD